MAEMTQKKNTGKAIVAGGLACALGVGGMLAFFVDTDIATNAFKIGKDLDIEVVEPQWNPENAKDLVPTQSVAKNPMLVNVTSYKAYMWADVVCPWASVICADEHGVVEDAAQARGLFELTGLSDKWASQYKQGDEGVTQDPTTGLYGVVDETAGTITFRFLLNECVVGATESSPWHNENAVAGENAVPGVDKFKGTATDPIFTNAKLVNLIEGQSQAGIKNIVVNGYGVQAEGFGNAAEAMAAAMAQKPGAGAEA